MNYDWTLEDPEPIVRVYCAGLPISAAQVGDDEVRALVGTGQGGSTPDATGGPGDEYFAAAQRGHRRCHVDQIFETHVASVAAAHARIGLLRQSPQIRWAVCRRTTRTRRPASP